MNCRPKSCINCGREFKPRGGRQERCPSCDEAWKRSQRREYARVNLEPGSCHSCRSADSDRRGIAVCPQFGRRPCAEVNPDHNCRLRVPEERPAETEESITDTLIRRGHQLIHRSEDEIKAMLEARRKRKLARAVVRGRAIDDGTVAREA